MIENKKIKKDDFYEIFQEIFAQNSNNEIEKFLRLSVNVRENELNWLVAWTDLRNNKNYQQSYTDIESAIKCYNEIELENKEEMKPQKQRIWIGHFYGYTGDWERKTGYQHGEYIEDFLGTVLDKIGKAGLNFMIKQNVKFSENVGGGTGVVVWVSYDNFIQR